MNFLNQTLDSLEDQIVELRRERNALRAENAGLVDDMNLLRDNNASLRARIEEMEKQEPVKYEFQGRDGKWYPFIDQRHYENTVADGTWPIRSLYALPGTKTQGEENETQREDPRGSARAARNQPLRPGSAKEARGAVGVCAC